MNASSDGLALAIGLALLGPVFIVGGTILAFALGDALRSTIGRIRGMVQ